MRSHARPVCATGRAFSHFGHRGQRPGGRVHPPFSVSPAIVSHNRTGPHQLAERPGDCTVGIRQQPGRCDSASHETVRLLTRVASDSAVSSSDVFSVSQRCRETRTSGAHDENPPCLLVRATDPSACPTAIHPACHPFRACRRAAIRFPGLHHAPEASGVVFCRTKCPGGALGTGMESQRTADAT